jgi:ribose transport system substrate-binding protein
MKSSLRYEDHRRSRLLAKGTLLASLCLLLGGGCRKSKAPAIVVIPRTTGTMLWEPVHRGAEAAALSLGANIYWNAPTREDDTGGQIALIERVTAGEYAGMVIAPDQSLALVTPVRRALARGLPIVIIGSPLLIPAGGKLFYILNNEQEGGKIAAQRIASLLHGRGSVAVLGMNPDIAGIMVRTRSFEQFLTENYPNIHIVEKRLGSFNVPHEQQVAEETLKAFPSLDAIVALTAATTRGALSTIDSDPAYRSIKVIGFDPDQREFSSASLDSVILENMPEMGDRAVSLIHAEREGKPVPSQMEVEPMLVTRENVNSDEVLRRTSMDYRPAPFHLDWSNRP